MAILLFGLRQRPRLERVLCSNLDTPEWNGTIVRLFCNTLWRER